MAWATMHPCNARDLKLMIMPRTHSTLPTSGKVLFMRPAIALLLLASLMLSAAALAQSPVIPVWPGPPPGSEDWAQKRTESEIMFGKDTVIHNVVQPTLTPFLPDPAKANGTAIIICPGGGFRILAFDHEGVQVARWLSERGVAAFVLKYRLVDTGTTEDDLRKGMSQLMAGIAKAPEADKYAGLKADPLTMEVVPLAVADGKQAIKLVRSRAAEWNIAPDRIGIMGFSAGAGVTTGVVLECDAESRPNFAAPIYGGILSEMPVAPDAPPMFVLAANDDPLAGSSIGIASLWKAARRPVELHIYSKGGHGFGMKKQNLPVDGWIDRFGEWLDYLGYFKPAEGPESTTN